MAATNGSATYLTVGSTVCNITYNFKALRLESSNIICVTVLSCFD